MILSRVAETIYWMARYVERTENTARIIMVNANLLLDLPKGIAPGWEPILAITGSSKLYYEHYTELNERNIVKFLISDRYNPGSIVNSVDYARENLRTSRAIAPRGVWEVLNDLHYYVEKNKAKGISRKGRYEYLKHVIRSCQLINGSITSTMSHDQTYEFVCLGRNLERADMTTRVLEVRTRDLLPDLTNELKPFDDIQWKSIMDSLAAYQMYRRHVRLRVKGSAVLGYLLQDKQFPHSVGHCITQVENSLRSLPDNETCLRMLGRVQRQVFDADVTDMRNSKLDEFLNGLQVMLGYVHDQIEATYFQTERLTQESTEKPGSEDTKNGFAA